jgi:hypothetical protein
LSRRQQRPRCFEQAHYLGRSMQSCLANGLVSVHDDDLRRDPLEVRKATLASIVAKAGPGIRFNEHIEGDGPTVFAHACKMGLEGIVSKQRDSAYRSGPRRACYRQNDLPASTATSAKKVLGRREALGDSAMESRGLSRRKSQVGTPMSD